MESTLSPMKLVPLTNVLSQQIAAKSEDEVAKITKALRATEAAFDEVLEFIKPGVTEKAIAAELVYRQLKHGADGISPEFWPIVAFGAGSAVPHALAGNTKLEPNQA